VRVEEIDLPRESRGLAQFVGVDAGDEFASRNRATCVQRCDIAGVSCLRTTSRESRSA
jgi:hypothetical protein